MNTLEALILGMIQGVTEFFPVSSSGHLALGELFLGMQHFEEAVTFNVILHLGTLFAIIAVYFREIRSVFQGQRLRMFQVILGTLPLFPLALLVKPIKELMTNPHVLGYAFILTATLLFIGEKFSKEMPKDLKDKKKWKNPLIIGLFQALALLPGVSRSGSTISAAKMLGWSRLEAVQFSFLLAIPAILGATSLEVLMLFKDGVNPELHNSIGLTQYGAGFCSSFAVGFFSLKALHRMAIKGGLTIFAWYCLVVGILTTVYTNIYL